MTHEKTESRKMAEEDGDDAPTRKRKYRPADGESDAPLAKKKRQSETRLLDLPDLPLEMIAGFVAESGSSFSIASCCKRLAALLPQKQFRKRNDARTVLRTREADAFDVLEAFGHSVPAISRCAYAAEVGNLPLLMSTRESGCPWNEMTIEIAAAEGHLTLVKYMRENGCPWSNLSCNAAARGGHLTVFIYLYENGCPCDVNTCWAAAIVNGHVAIMRYLREDGYPWNRLSLWLAVLEGYLPLVKYMHENGCPWHARMREAAAEHPDCLRYLDENGCPAE